MTTKLATDQYDRIIVSVLDYGASPSASGAVNSAAFNAALATEQSVFVPAGAYDLADPVQIKFDGQALFGEGTYNTELYWVGTDNTKNMLEMWTGRRDTGTNTLSVTNSAIRNFKISTKTGSAVASLIWVEAGNFHGWIEKIRGFDIRGSVPQTGVIKYDSNGGQSYSVGMNTKDVVITGGANDDLSPFPYGIWIESCIEHYFESVKVYNTQIGWQFGTPTSGDVRNVSNSTFVHCHSEIGDRAYADNNGRAFLFYQGRDLQFYGCKIIAGASYTVPTTQVPLRFLGVDGFQNKNITFRDCTIWGDEECANAMTFGSTANYQGIKFLGTEFFQFTGALATVTGDNIPTMYFDEDCYFTDCEATLSNFDIESSSVDEEIISNAFGSTIDLQSGSATTQAKREEAILVGHSTDTQGVVYSGYKASPSVIQLRGYNRTGGDITIADGYYYTRHIGPNNSVLTASTSYNPPSILSGDSAFTTITVPGVALGDMITANFDKDMQDMNMFAYASAADTVTVYFVNRTSSTRDLDVGNLRVYKLGSIIDYYGSTTYDPPNLAANAGVTTTVTVSGASVGDIATFSFSLDLQGIVGYAWVSAADTVSVRFQNESGGTLDLASGTLMVGVIETPRSI